MLGTHRVIGAPNSLTYPTYLAHLLLASPVGLQGANSKEVYLPRVNARHDVDTLVKYTAGFDCRRLVDLWA